MIVGHPRELLRKQGYAPPHVFRCRGRVYRRVQGRPWDEPERLDGVVWLRFRDGVDASTGYVLYETKEAIGTGRFITMLYEWQPGGIRPCYAGFGMPLMVAQGRAA